MALIEGVVKRGHQAVMLIPEIALTYQTVLRFYKRFGDRVSVMNSTLSAGEKYDQCERAKRREIDVIIGPRSALFTPFPDIGLIVIDEEHEGSYKSETMPKYHARETAEELARLHGAAVFLGSATPSLESFYRAKEGRYRLYTLTERLNGGALPDRVCGGPETGAEGGKPLHFFQKAADASGGPVCQRGTEHAVSEPQGLCGLRFLPHVRSCDEVPPLRRLPFGAQKRHPGLSLLRLYASGGENLPRMRFPLYSGLPGGNRADRGAAAQDVSGQKSAADGRGHHPEKGELRTDPRLLCRRRGGRAGGHPDDRQGTRFSRR